MTPTAYTFHVTERQSEAISNLISYPDQEQAANAMGIDFASYRNLLARARKTAGVDTNVQLVHYWTVRKVTLQIQNNF